MNAPALAEPTMASYKSVKIKHNGEGGWARFASWVAGGNPVLLAQRMRKGYPLLAAAVPLDWANATEDQSSDELTPVEAITSHQARQYLADYCRILHAREADGAPLRYDVRSYSRSGALRSESTAAASSDLFALVGVQWYARVTGATLQELSHVGNTLPWTDPGEHR